MGLHCVQSKAYKSRRKSNRVQLSFSVNIIRENFIPEGLDLAVIEKMLEIPGMRLAGTDMEYAYTAKPNTNVVVEMLSIDFVRPVKV